MLTVGSGINIGPGITLSKGVTGGSLLFSGANSYLQSSPNNSATNTLLTLGDGNFTVECWLYISSSMVFTGINRSRLIGTYIDPVYKYKGFAFSLGKNWYTDSSPSIFWEYRGGYSEMRATMPSTNQWHHIAVVRNGNTQTMYIDGNSVANFTYNGSATEVAPLLIGATIGGVEIPFSGNINNIRIVKGVAVYTSNFTPPTQDLSAIQSANVNGNPSAAISSGQTALLMNTPNGANFLQDGSVNNISIVQGGNVNVTSSTSAPF